LRDGLLGRREGADEEGGFGHGECGAGGLALRVGAAEGYGGHDGGFEGCAGGVLV
jgi:hypothetical protein